MSSMSKSAPTPAANRMNDRVDFFIFHNVRKLRFFRINNFSAERQDSLEFPISPLALLNLPQNPLRRNTIRFSLHYETVQVLVSRKVVYLPFCLFFPLRASSRALRAASRTCCARIAFTNKRVQIAQHSPQEHRIFALKQQNQPLNVLHLCQVYFSFVLQIAVDSQEYERK